MDENMEIEETPSSLPPHMQDNQEAVMDVQFNPESNQDQQPVSGVVNMEPEAHDVNDPKPGSLFLRGVDDLNTRIIKAYVDKIIKPDYTFAEKERFSKFDYQIEWVNDTSLNLKFEDPAGSMEAMELLTDKEKLDGRDYNLIGDLEERPCIDLVKEDGDTAELCIRQSTWGDKKVKDSRTYSRYYLLHGEPERRERLPAARVRQELYREDYDSGPDLITGEQQETQGIFGYEADREMNSPNSKNEFTSKYRERDSYRRGGRRGTGTGKYKSEDRWISDKFIDRKRGYHGTHDHINNSSDRRNNRNKRNRNDNRNNNRNAGSRDDEGDLFPDFFKDKESESSGLHKTQIEEMQRDRSRSPSRIVEE